MIWPWRRLNPQEISWLEAEARYHHSQVLDSWDLVREMELLLQADIERYGEPVEASQTESKTGSSLVKDSV